MKLANKIHTWQSAWAAYAIIVSFAGTERGEDPPATGHKSTQEMAQPIFKSVQDYKWTRILPDLGDSSPEICVVHVEPKTGATKLMIRTSKGIHIRKHWHTANETHTVIHGTVLFACDGKRTELGPGSFNYMPAKMTHEAWLPADSLTFITVDGPWDVNWTEGPPTAADITK
jgi:mannose-6-phosphate isomerase-like protein (cupin superfamily)